MQRIGLMIFVLLAAEVMSMKAAAAPADGAYRIIPAPVSIEYLPGSLTTGPQTRIVLGATTTAADSFAAAEFNAWIAERGITPLAVVHDEAPRPGDILLGAPGDRLIAAWLETSGMTAENGGAESYLLTVGSGGAIAAADSAAGRFYAMMSLAQLLEKTPIGASIPAVVIRDRPSLGLRGVSDDISRGQTSTMEDFRRLIRLLARWKMNLYTPYMEDMFELKSHPAFTEGRGAFTADEARELCAYAAQYHVRVIPIFQCLGHLENVLIKPEFEHLAEFPGAHCLSPAVDESYEFLRDALSEVVPAFSDQFFHVGCDESWDIGRGKSRSMVAANGLSGAHALHYNKVHELVTGMGRRMMMYGDIILNNPKILDQIPRDIVIVDWHYNAAKTFPSVKKFRDAGFNVLVSPSVVNYNKIYPDWNSALTNIEYLTLAGIENGALGSLVSCWGDNGAFALRQYNLWGYAFGAAVAWNHRMTDQAALEDAFWRSLLGVENTSALVQANALLATLGRKFTLYDWWRHPLLGISSSGPVRDNESPLAAGAKMAADMQRAGELLASIDSGAVANGWCLELLKFAAGCGEQLAGKYTWNGLYDSGADSGALRESTLSLHRGAHRLRGQYSDLWLRFNRPEGLEKNIDMFDRQLGGWAGAVQATTNGARPEAADIPSRWIAPAGSSAKNKLRRPRSSYIRCEFNVATGPGGELPPMLLQLMGESHVEGWLNGKHFAHVTARRSLSITVEFERAKIYDLGGMLAPGRNVLALKVTNYEGRTPGVNAFGEIYAPDGSVADRLLSVPGWKGVESETEPAGWNQPGFKGAWKACEKYSLGARVSTPELAAGVNSRIQR